MKNLKTVTVYRYDERRAVWSKWELKNVFYTDSTNDYTLSDTLNKNVNLTLRVMDDTVCDVIPSDVIYLGVHQGEIPPDDVSVVVSVVRNEHGVNTRHTKILCR